MPKQKKSLIKQEITAVQVLASQADFYRLIQKNIKQVDWTKYKPEELPIVMVNYLAEVFGKLAYLTDGLLGILSEKEKPKVN